MSAVTQEPTPRQRVETALRGGHGGVVPFTMYESKIPQCAEERAMRNRGLCVVDRTHSYRSHSPNVKTTSHDYYENGKRFVRTVHETPVGTLSTVHQPAGFTSWRHEHLFKSPDDYKALLFMIRDARFEPAYEAAARRQERWGGDGIVRDTIGLEPLQTLISGTMGTQTFCIEWMTNRDEVLKLYEATVERNRLVYPIVAQGPLGHANYGGNVVADIIGLENFERYYLPHYEEAAEVLHRHGKLIGSHHDANVRLFAEAIGRSALDYIEAFTPAPDTNLTMAEARAAWPGKTLWINFPSSLHLASDERIRAATLDLLDQAGTPDGVIFGITEDMPPERWRDSCRAIMDGLDRHAADHPDLYA
jgi:hypothetical protein